MWLLVMLHWAYCIPIALCFDLASTPGTDRLALQALRNIEDYQSKRQTSSQCTLSAAYQRKEWSSLIDEEKVEYIGAVLCLMSKPSISGKLVPGARNRYDDFLGTHINQTLDIHATGSFLSWHRYFIWTYEQALRKECGYKGYQPYINWGKYALNVTGAPIFDGSNTSLSGNGAYNPYNGTRIPAVDHPLIVIPHGNGTGCVTTGPFKHMTVNLGPVSPVLADVPQNPRPDGLGYNPRCLRRDISQFTIGTAATDENSTDLITQSSEIRAFQDVMQGGFNQGLPLLGVHTAGHYIVGGDPGGDLFASPGDPYFYLNHAQIDRLWWIWQNQDIENRQDAIAGTQTINNSPPSRNTTLEDVIDLGMNAKGRPIKELMSSLGGPFCYIYT